MRTFRLYSLLLLANFLLAIGPIRGQLEQELRELEESLDTFSGTDRQRVDQLAELGYRYWIINPTHSIRRGSEALELARRIDYAAGIARANRVMGVGYWTRGQLEVAYRSLLAAQRGYRDLGDTLEVANTELNLGMVYADQQEYDLAERSYRSALETFRARGEDSREATTYTKIADLLTRKGEFEPAFDYLRQALTLHERADFTYGVAEVNRKLGELSLGEADYATAIAHFLLAIRQGAQRFDHVGLGESFYGIGIAYLRNGEPERAEAYLERAENMAEVMQLLTLKQRVFQARKELAASRRDYAVALEYADRYRSVSDTLYSQELTALMATYDARRRYEEKIAELDRSTTRVQLLEERRRADRQFRWILLLGLLLVSATAYLVLQRKERDIVSRDRRIRQTESTALGLRDELTEREQRLTTNTLQLAQKSTAISELKDRIDSLRRRVPAEVRPEVQQLSRQLAALIGTDEEWNDFRRHFEGVHGALTVRLHQQYPGLTQNEFRLIALLRMNLSTKEIGGILGISPDSVKTARYRLRKKLGLETATNLYDFLIALGEPPTESDRPDS